MKWTLFIILLAWVQTAAGQADTAQKIVPGRKNSPAQQEKPYVILISVDGFRHDYASLHGAGFLEQQGRDFTKAAYMLPSYPSLTFPNHYTLVTGLYPSHHGLVDNHFFDPQWGEGYSMRQQEKVSNGRWYGGTPLWVLAEKQQMVSASFYWVGSEAAIQDTRPTYYYPYNEKIGMEQRIQVVVDWLSLPAERRPHFISFYFPEVDHAGHDHGPEAPETAQAVRWVDSALQRLTAAVEKTGLPVNFILVSDHGMTPVDTAAPAAIPAVDTAKAILAGGAELLHVHFKNRHHIQPLYRSLRKKAIRYTVTRKETMPGYLHYDKKNDVYNRIGDILLISKWPHVFAAKGKNVKPGAHGFDPVKVPDMRAVFYAWGPGIKKRNAIPPIRNVDVYAVVAKLLDLPLTEKTDGDSRIAASVLQEP